MDRVKPDWSTDAAGVQHWRGELDHRSAVHDAAARCLVELPGYIHGRRPGAPAWFWWRGVPCPIRIRPEPDTVGSLVDRWHDWRDASEHVHNIRDEVDRPTLLDLLDEWSKS